MKQHPGIQGLFTQEIRPHEYLKDEMKVSFEVFHPERMITFVQSDRTGMLERGMPPVVVHDCFVTYRKEAAVTALRKKAVDSLSRGVKIPVINKTYVVLFRQWILEVAACDYSFFHTGLN